jgi:hypothetical protein
MTKCPGNRPLGYGQGAYGQMPYGESIPGQPPVFNPGPGYVSPSDTNNELNDMILRRFLQQVVVGIAGLDPTLVRPRWQPEPANQPDFDVDWAALGTIRRERETFAAVLHCTDDEDTAYDTVYRNHILEILCSFYGPNSESNSEVLAMGLMLEQNRYALQVNGFGLVDVGETLVVPALLKDRWLMGMDVPFRLRRQQAYTYPSPNFESAQVILYTDTPPETIDITAGSTDSD